MARLFVDAARLAAARVVLEGEEHRYVCRVLRLGVGDHVTLFDGRGGECDARLGRVGAHAAEAEILERRLRPAPARPAVTLLVGLCKGERMDFVVQKATELGAARVIPVVTARAVPRLDAERARGRGARWRTIAREAARQCGRADVPEVDAVASLTEALAAVAGAALKVLFWEESSAPLGPIVAGLAPATTAVLVGPEGGLTPAEVAAGRDLGFAVASLGPRILRAETAAVVALALLGYVVGDLGGR